jgi:hypothetical protein
MAQSDASMPRTLTSEPAPCSTATNQARHTASRPTCIESAPTPTRS